MNRLVDRNDKGRTVNLSLYQIGMVVLLAHSTLQVRFLPCLLVTMLYMTEGDSSKLSPKHV